MWSTIALVTAVGLRAVNGTCYLPVPQSFLNPFHPWLLSVLVSVARPIMWPKLSLLKSLCPSNYSLFRLRFGAQVCSQSQSGKRVPWGAQMGHLGAMNACPSLPLQYKRSPTASCWSSSIVPVRWWLLGLSAGPRTQGMQSVQVAATACCVLWRGTWVASVCPLWVILVEQSPALKGWGAQCLLACHWE